MWKKLFIGLFSIFVLFIGVFFSSLSVEAFSNPNDLVDSQTSTSIISISDFELSTTVVNGNRITASNYSKFASTDFISCKDYSRLICNLDLDTIRFNVRIWFYNSDKVLLGSYSTGWIYEPTSEIYLTDISSYSNNVFPFYLIIQIQFNEVVSYSSFNSFDFKFLSNAYSDSDSIIPSLFVLSDPFKIGVNYIFSYTPSSVSVSYTDVSYSDVVFNYCNSSVFDTSIYNGKNIIEVASMLASSYGYELYESNNFNDRLGLYLSFGSSVFSFDSSNYNDFIYSHNDYFNNIWNCSYFINFCSRNNTLVTFGIKTNFINYLYFYNNDFDFDNPKFFNNHSVNSVLFPYFSESYKFVGFASWRGLISSSDSNVSYESSYYYVSSDYVVNRLYYYYGANISRYVILNHCYSSFDLDQSITISNSIRCAFYNDSFNNSFTGFLDFRVRLWNEVLPPEFNMFDETPTETGIFDSFRGLYYLFSSLVALIYEFSYSLTVINSVYVFVISLFLVLLLLNMINRFNVL